MKVKFLIAVALKLAMGGLLLAVLLTVWPRVALAHAVLVRSEPAGRCGEQDCPVLTSPPTSIHLWFSESVQSVRHGLVVIAPTGQQVQQGAIQNDGPEISIAVNASASGTYQVLWQVVSGDTHPATGSFTFSVGYTSPVASPVSQAQLGSVAPLGLVLQTVARWLHLLGYALAFGPLLFGLFVLGPLMAKASPEQNANVQLHLWRLSSRGLLLLLLAEPLALLGETSSLGASQIFDLDLAGDMLSSSFGRVLAQRLGAAIFLWVLLGIIKQGTKNAANYVAMGAGGLLALADGQASHAVSSGPLWVGLLANAVHITAMGAWVGGLLTLWAVWNFAPLQNHRAAMLQRFGRLAAVSLLWLVVSGLLMAYLHLAQPSDLLKTDYGQTLSLKLVLLALVVLAASLALLRHSQTPRRWWLVEVVALPGIVLLAALLVSLPPPA